MMMGALKNARGGCRACVTLYFYIESRLQETGVPANARHYSE